MVLITNALKNCCHTLIKDVKKNLKTIIMRKYNEILLKSQHYDYDFNYPKLYLNCIKFVLLKKINPVIDIKTSVIDT